MRSNLFHKLYLYDVNTIHLFEQMQCYNMNTMEKKTHTEASLNGIIKIKCYGNRPLHFIHCFLIER